MNCQQTSGKNPTVYIVQKKRWYLLRNHPQIFAKKLQCVALALSPLHTCELNGLWTKCPCVWTGLQACTAPSANGSHIIHCKLKFVGFLHKHKGNWVHREAPSVLCLPQVRRKLIYHMYNTNCLWFACVYWPLQFGGRPVSANCLYLEMEVKETRTNDTTIIFSG